VKLSDFQGGNNMYLCFGTFAAVLNCCKQNIKQYALFAIIAKCLDKNSNYIKSDDRYKESWEIEGDGPAISKLLNCTKNYVLENKLSLELSKVVKDFEINVAPYIEEDKKPAVILSLLNIIQLDKSLDFKNKEAFRKNLGVYKQDILNQSKFEFCDFLVRILLYTTCGNVDNKMGKDYVESITKCYVDKFIDDYAFEYEWNSTAQTLTLLPISSIFSDFSSKISLFKIDEFIESVDPTNVMDYEWVDKCDGFIKYIKSTKWIPFEQTPQNMSGMTIQKVQLFAQVLNEYVNYLGVNMRPIEEQPDLFIPIPLVPLYRDEDAKWACAFWEKVQDYRKQLASIYQEILFHIHFAINNANESK